MAGFCSNKEIRPKGKILPFGGTETVWPLCLSQDTFSLSSKIFLDPHSPSILFLSGFEFSCFFLGFYFVLFIVYVILIYGIVKEIVGIRFVGFGCFAFVGIVKGGGGDWGFGCGWI